VEAWKGITKYAGLTVLGVAAGIGFLHHLIMGPNRVSESDEEHAEELTEGSEDGRV
jgi:formate dehydrogenase iron-sulfur subunit